MPLLDATTALSMLASDAAAFDVYGFRSTIQGSLPWAVESLAQDFAHFRTGLTGGGRTIQLLEEEPDYMEFGPKILVN